MKLMPTITINSQVSLSNPSVYIGFEHLLLLAIIEIPGFYSSLATGWTTLTRKARNIRNVWEDNFLFFISVGALI